MFLYIGLSFLIPGVTNVPLDPRFAAAAAYGDLVAAVLALVAVLALFAKPRHAVAIVWIFNVAGLADFLIAVTQA